MTGPLTHTGKSNLDAVMFHVSYTCTLHLCSAWLLTGHGKGPSARSKSTFGPAAQEVARAVAKGVTGFRISAVGVGILLVWVYGMFYEPYIDKLL